MAGSRVWVMKSRVAATDWTGRSPDRRLSRPIGCGLSAGAETVGFDGLLAGGAPDLPKTRKHDTKLPSHPCRITHTVTKHNVHQGARKIANNER